MSGPEMPYGLSVEGLKQRCNNRTTKNDDHVALAEKLGVPVDSLISGIAVPHFLNIQYEFGSVVGHSRTCVYKNDGGQCLVL